jgi:hypothetical protein
MWIAAICSGALLIAGSGVLSASAAGGVALDRGVTLELARIADLYATAVAESDAEAVALQVEEALELVLADPVLGGEISEYVVLVPDSSFAEALAPYVWIRQAQGYQVTVHDLLAELGPAFTPHEIRAFLQDRYLDGTVRYLMIIGDDELIPMLPAYGHVYYTYTYTDYYYGDLEGDWDVDGDGVYGEMVDDAIDFEPEMLVTRIPCTTPQEGLRMLAQALRYRLEYSPAYGNGILMAGTISIEGESGLLQNVISTLLGARGFRTVRVYDTDTFRYNGFEIPLNPDYTYDEVSIPEVWNAGLYGLVYDISHGSDTGVMGFSASEIPDLDLAFPGYFVAAACATSHPTSGRNFSERLMSEGGCAGVIGATNVVTPGDGARLASGIFAEVAFAVAAVRPNCPLGQAVNAVKVAYYHMFVEPETDPEWLELYGQNLKGYLFFGDPEVPIRRLATR